MGGTNIEAVNEREGVYSVSVALAPWLGIKKMGAAFQVGKISAPLKGNIHVDTCSMLVIIFGVSLVLDRIFSSQC